MRVAQHTSIDVDLSQRKPLHGNVVVVGLQAIFSEERLGLMSCFVWVVRQHPLVEALRRRQRRLIAEQHLKKRQVLDVPSEHDQTDGQRRGQEEPHRPPKQRPKGGGNDDGNGGQTCGVTIQPRFDYLTGYPLGDKKESGDPKEHRPSRIDGKGEGCRKRRGDNWPDIGNETQEHRQRAPEDRVWHAEEPQPRADQHAQTRVHRELTE